MNRRLLTSQSSHMWGRRSRIARAMAPRKTASRSVVFLAFLHTVAFLVALVAVATGSLAGERYDFGDANKTLVAKSPHPTIIGAPLIAASDVIVSSSDPKRSVDLVSSSFPSFPSSLSSLVDSSVDSPVATGR